MILAIVCIKGGTGKSSTAAGILQAGAEEGRRVLGVDLDPQANLTSFLSANQNLPGAWHVLQGAEAKECIQHTPQNIDVIAGLPELATEKTRAGSARRLADALGPIKKRYSLTVIDTPPMLGELAYNAIYAADKVLIPVQSDASSLQGMYQAADTAREIGCDDVAVVVAQYDGRARINRMYLDAIKDAAAEVGAPVIGTIRQTCSVREAQALRLSLYQHAPTSTAAKDYKELYQKLIGG